MVYVRSMAVTAENLAVYSQIPIAFEVRSRLDPATRDETPVAPWTKDYDAIEDSHPVDWADRFDLSRWVLITAWEETQMIAGAVVAWDTPGVHMLEGRSDLAVLWDIRVHPTKRGHGAGKALFRTAVQWAAERGCTELKAETQDINVVACRFYAAMGCELVAIDENPYEGLDEVQLVWSYDVRVSSPTS